MENFKNLAIEIMAEICETDEIKDDLDLDLVDAGLIDSLSIINIILLLEEKTGVKFQPTDFEKKDIYTTNNFINFLKEKLK